MGKLNHEFIMLEQDQVENKVITEVEGFREGGLSTCVAESVCNSWLVNVPILNGLQSNKRIEQIFASICISYCKV